MASSHQKQDGFSTIAAVGALIGLGVVFLTIFLFANSGNSNNRIQSNKNPTEQDSGEQTASEPPFIRLPENSKIYRSQQYKFSFAYPDSFGELKDVQIGSSTNTIVDSAESASAVGKPIGGASAAVLNGKMGVYVYDKDNFKVVVQRPDISVAPTTTGSSTTWKVVSGGTANNKSYSVGQAYDIPVVKSQTGVTVFDFTLRDAGNVLGRWVFASGDYYVLVALPTVSKVSGTALEARDIASYTIIGTNIAKTTRVQAAANNQSQNQTPDNSSGN